MKFRVIGTLSLINIYHKNHQGAENVFHERNRNIGTLGIKNSLVHLKEVVKLYIKLYYRLFMSCLVFKIFRLKK
jgi:hypothetical protein